jgi:hypothetical protein
MSSMPSTYQKLQNYLECQIEPFGIAQDKLKSKLFFSKMTLLQGFDYAQPNIHIIVPIFVMY